MPKDPGHGGSPSTQRGLPTPPIRRRLPHVDRRPRRLGSETVLERRSRLPSPVAEQRQVRRESVAFVIRKQGFDGEKLLEELNTVMHN